MRVEDRLELYGIEHDRQKLQEIRMEAERRSYQSQRNGLYAGQSRSLTPHKVLTEYDQMQRKQADLRANQK